jgi:cysteine desulfurase
MSSSGILHRPMHWADARDAIERARSEVASLVGAFADEIVFTSGGTEASNIAIRGDVTMEPARRAVVTTNIEHPATEGCSDLLERAGHPVSRVAAKADGCSNVPEVASIRLPWRRQPPMTQRL